MSTYFYAVCDVCKRVCPCTTTHGVMAPENLLHPFILAHVYCGTKAALATGGPDFVSSVRIVDEHSWENEQAATETNGWKKIRTIADVTPFDDGE